MARDEVVEEAEGTEGEILRFYQKNLFTGAEFWRSSMDICWHGTITEDEQRWLERDFKEKEIREAIKLYALDKDQGPDDFTMAFYQKAWHILRVDVVKSLNTSSRPAALQELAMPPLLPWFPRRRVLKSSEILGSLI